MPHDDYVGLLQKELHRLGTIVDSVRATAQYHLRNGDDVNACASGVLADIEEQHTGDHVYFSTSCLHDNHDYCKAKTGAVGAKVPATCKFCAAPCICFCHKEDS